MTLLTLDRHDQVKLYLDEYFKRSIAVIKGHGMDQGLCLLCIQCFEVCHGCVIFCVYIASCIQPSPMQYMYACI